MPSLITGGKQKNAGKTRPKKEGILQKDALVSY